MKIEWTQAGLRKNEMFFTSAYGDGKGIWCGPERLPTGETEVEFELSQLFMRWVDIIPAGSSPAGIALERDKVVFTGLLEDIDEEGTGYLRIGGGLIMFESLGEPMALGNMVEVRADEVRIYPLVL
ncbi:hypothetical protein J7E73_28915 [Paenibacillus albidus]|uniref:hypothetical protein n=1 Tax=Paenibacillus albidus TaxID=2041023 RepID=UPI001BEBF9CB|nr:hypothetical protein [Paenibacillus albidus]MBT2293063.1 hypothetical protein [Paenibacillus albidus]